MSNEVFNWQVHATVQLQPSRDQIRIPPVVLVAGRQTNLDGTRVSTSATMSLDAGEVRVQFGQ